MKFTPSQSISARIAGALLLAAAAVLPARADYPSTVLSQSPVGYWRLNETTQPLNATTTVNYGSLGVSAAGTYNNSSSGGQPGPFAGSTSVGLDGISQTVTTPYQAALNPSSFTIEAWVNPVSAAVSGGLLCLASSVHAGSPRSGWLIYQSDGSAAGSPPGTGYLLRIYYTNSTAFNIQLLAPQTVVAGTWTHVVFTFNGTTATAYINGAQVSTATATAFVPNVDSAFSVGARSDGGFPWPGNAAEVAYYSTVLSGSRVSAHYMAGTITPATYQSTVSADSPLLYWRFAEASQPPAANIGTLGAAGNGYYLYDTTAGQPGPSNPPFVGFEAANLAPVFHGAGGAGGVVHLPALNLNNNNVTISCWINASGPQTTSAGLVVNDLSASGSGLTIDPVSGGLGLGVLWGGSTFGWSPTTDSGLPTLVDSTWCYAALVIQPTEATLYICDTNNFGHWATASYIGVNNGPRPFSAATLIGGVSGSTPALNFNGSIDEVAIFNRALGQGELYTEYANAIGGVPPHIFTDIQGPPGPVAAGDPITLTIDAGGTTPTYTWHKNGGTIATTTIASYTIPSSALTDSGNYDVTITGTGSPAQSGTIAVSVVTPSLPAIVGTQGFFSRTLYPTGTLAMAVSATGGGLKYQWYKNASPIASATASALTLPNLTTANAGNYSVSVTNSVGAASNGPVAITIPTLTPGSYAALVVAGGPEAWWRLDETSGTNMLDGMGRHDGTYTNANGGIAPLPTFGVPGIAAGGDTAVSFTRNGGIGIVPYSADLNSSVAYTYEAWVKTTDLSTFQVPFSSVDANGGKWWAMATGTTPVTWEPGATGGYYDLWNYSGGPPQTYTMLPVASGVWTHLVMVYAAGGFPWTLFVNGQQVATSWSLPPNTINTSAPFVIGCAATTSPLAGTFFNGQVDEVAVYKRALGGAEVLNHFNAGFPPTPPSFSTPFLSQTVTVGKSVSFSTTAQGTTPIRLQWYKGSTPIAGQTNGTFSIASVAQSDTATYTLWATNAAGVASQSANLTVILPVPYANITNGLVLHLKMDGDTTDSSGRGNNGTPVGGPTFVTGQIGQGLNTVTTVVTNNATTNLVFNSASYVVLGSLADLQFGAGTSWSASMWVKLATGSMPVDIPFIGTATNSNGSLGWDMSPGYENGGYQWTLNDGTNNLNVSSASGTINDGNWHYFALVVDRTGHTASTYFDGHLVAANDITGLGSVDGGGFVVIAQDPTETYNPTGSPFTAADAAAFPSSISIDDMGIWRRALSALEVAKIQSAGANGGHSFDLPAPPVTITVSRSGGNVTLNWATGILLQSTSLGAGASWVPVTGATPPSYTFTPTGTTKFFRVITQ